MNPLEILSFLARFLKPPRHDAPPEKVMKWRWHVAVALGAVIVICALGDAAVFRLWFQGVTQRTLILELVNDQIIGVHQKYCDEKNGDARGLYGRELQWLSSEYRDMTGRKYDLPECSA
jgi:hypothetical protein